MFSWLSNLAAGGIPNFPYTLGESFGEFAPVPGVRWSMRKGTENETNAVVTIFTLDVSGAEAAASASTSYAAGGHCDANLRASLGRNAMKKTKTLKLPGFLRCFEAVEHKDTIYVATEQCVTLRTAITDKRQELYGAEDDKFSEGAALGLHTLATALESLHRNNLAHHNVSLDSIVVLPSGEWRLFGLELVGTFDEEHGAYSRMKPSLPDVRVPPGRGLSTVSSVDAWSIGCLIYEVFNREKAAIELSHADLRAASAVPRKLQPSMTGLLAAEGKMRWTMAKFLSDCALFKDSHYVSDLQALGELSLRDATERDAFYRKLGANVDHYPLAACKHLILPKLQTATQYGASSAVVLEPLMKIGTRLEPSEFAEFVAPSVITLFANPDVVIRLRLLENAKDYAPLLPSTLVQEKIWAHFAAGFTHKNPEVREITVRTLIYFAPHITERTLTGDVVRFLSTLQQDREGTIRTNATICLGMIGKFFPEAERGKVLSNGFGRMLKDPFTPSRLAAVRSFASCVDSFSGDTIANKLLPAVTPLLVDPVEDVRKASFKCVGAMMKRVEAYAAAMPKSPEEEAGAAAPAETTTAAAVPSPSIPPQSPLTASTIVPTLSASAFASDVPTGESRPSGMAAVPAGGSKEVAAAPAANLASSAEQSKGGGWFGWGSKGAATSTTPNQASSADISPGGNPSSTSPHHGSNRGGPSLLSLGEPSDSVPPSVPTAARAKVHEDPTASNTGSNNWLDEMSGGTPTSKPVRTLSANTNKLATTGSGSGMTLRKKGLAGSAVKKAD